MAATMRKDKLTALVLGVGGNVGQGILKALACSNLDCRVVGACTSASAFGLFSVDCARISPLADSPEFLGWLIEICHDESVDVVLSGVEPVLDVLARNHDTILTQTGAVCIVNDIEAMNIGADKLRTCEWLRDEGLPYPRHAVSEDSQGVANIAATCGYPLIAKPRWGKGSQGIIVLQRKADLSGLLKLPGYVVQEMLGDDDSEYTAACITDRDNILRGIIVFHRFLTSGTTSCAIAGEYPEVRSMAAMIVEKLKPRGPCNVQMRMHHGQAVCFEINVRFSGTTPIRARLGFNDVEAAIRHFVMAEEAKDLPIIRSGQAIRYWNEAYIDPHAYAALMSEGELPRPQDFLFKIETYGNKI